MQLGRQNNFTVLYRRVRHESYTHWNQSNKFPRGILSSTTVNNTTVPGLLMGEGGRKLAGMDLSRSFCSATMKGSFKCSEGTRKREHRRVDHSAASVDENPKVHTGHMHKKRPFLLVSECTVINLSVWLDSRHFSWTGAGALIMWNWYFGWIVECTMNVKPFNCCFLGGTHTHTHTPAAVSIYSFLSKFLVNQCFLISFQQSFQEDDLLITLLHYVIISYT